MDRSKITRNSAIGRFSKFIENNLHDIDWTLIAQVCGATDLLDEAKHERLRRSQYFGDADYPSAAARFLQDVFDTDEQVGFCLIREITRPEYHTEDLSVDARNELNVILALFVENLFRQDFGSLGISGDSKSAEAFDYQFPAGLPFGLTKPNLAFFPERGTQRIFFESDRNVSVLRGDVYPNLTFQRLTALVAGTPAAKQGSLLAVLLGMNQTESEKGLFNRYNARFHVVENEVPILIPQAWIQWHSLTKANLRSQSSDYADALYRVDFVAFWAGKRFAVLVDDIGHYSKKASVGWIADQERYSKRLKEDRKLRREGWNVFRTSNWELRDEAITDEMLDDLRLFMGFEVS